MPELKELVALVQSWLAVALAGGVVVALLHYVHPATRQLLPPQRQRAVPWTGALVLVAFLAFAFVPLVILPFIKPAALAQFFKIDADHHQIHRLAAGVASLCALPLQLAAWRGLLAVTGAPITALCAFRRGSAVDFTVSYRTWLLLTPAVYAVNAIVLVVYGLVVGKQPEEHPIVQTFQGGSLPAILIVILVAEAVVVAPVREEFFFRGILQPWLTQRPWGGDLGLALAAFAGFMLSSSGGLAARLAPPLFILTLVPLYRFVDSWPGLACWLPVHKPAARKQAARAIFGASALFANFHASVWPTPIPLFVLALGLGWLAYRTQSVVAPILVHMMFNAVVFGALYFKG